jgi:hypothetical protein
LHLRFLGLPCGLKKAVPVLGSYASRNGVFNLGEVS